MPREHYLEPFYLIITDRDSGTFSVEGRPQDRRPIMEACRRRRSEIRATGHMLHRKWIFCRGHSSKLAPTIFREAGAVR